MRIAFFDSGIGGLTVLAEARRRRPDFDYLYYADCANAPYGSQPANAVRAHIAQAVEILEQKGIDALVVACNTATAVSIESLRAQYAFPIIGMEPAVKTALDGASSGRVLVMATSLTLQESKLSHLIGRLEGEGKVDRLAMDQLVSFAEQGEFNAPQVSQYIQAQLSHYRLEDYQALVLGCTHFIYFKPLLARYCPHNIDIVDGNAGTVQHLFRQLPADRTGDGQLDFLYSGLEPDALLRERLEGLLRAL